MGKVKTEKEMQDLKDLMSKQIVFSSNVAPEGSSGVKSRQVSESLKSMIKFSSGIDAGLSNNIRNFSINQFIMSFEDIWDKTDKNIIVKELKTIEYELDKMYIKGDIEALHSIKFDLIEEVYLSFSRIHGAIKGISGRVDVDEQKRFLLIDDYMKTNRFKQSYLRYLINYIDNYRFISVVTPNKKPSTKHVEQPITIEDISVNDKALDQIYGILINADLIDKDTKIFIDKKSGGKVFLCAILVYLYGKGYYKSNPTNEEYLNICLNSFGVKISLGTIKGKANFPMADVIKLNIPAFSTV